METCPSISYVSIQRWVTVVIVMPSSVLSLFTLHWQGWEHQSTLTKLFWTYLFVHLFVARGLFTITRFSSSVDHWSKFTEFCVWTFRHCYKIKRVIRNLLKFVIKNLIGSHTGASINFGFIKIANGDICILPIRYLMM